MDQEPFNPDPCRAIAKRNRAILEMLDDGKHTMKNPKAGAPPETWGAYAGRTIVESGETPPGSDWIGSLFPEPGDEPTLPPFVEPQGARDDGWWYGFYLGLLCAFAWYMDKTDAQEEGAQEDWARMGHRAITRVLRAGTKGGLRPRTALKPGPAGP
jgi:hypothetical protein